MRRLPPLWTAVLVTVAAAAVIAAVVLPTAGGGDAPPAPTTAAAPSPTRSDRGAQRDTPATPSSGGRAVPARIAGYRVSPVPIGTARESLVFRTRNSILNGLSGEASHYLVEIAQATRAGRVGLLVGVAAREGTAPPAIPDDIVRLIGAPPELRRAVAGREVAVYPASDSRLAVVDGGPGRAVVVIATGRGPALALGTAVARAMG
ncbi:MAG: hypothetical protein AB7V42_00920 [Thermoleophilia bacterium]